MARAIVSKHCRIRHPRFFRIGTDSIVDDFCYFSTKVSIGKYSHIASGCSIAGGSKHQFVLGNYCSISSGVKIWCQSNDFVNDLIVIVPPNVTVNDNPIAGDVLIGDMCGVGSNSVIMPDNRIPEGVSIGALSFVPPRFKFRPWSVYAGIPLRRICSRNKARVLSQMEILKKYAQFKT